MVGGGGGSRKLAPWVGPASVFEGSRQGWGVSSALRVRNAKQEGGPCRKQLAERPECAERPQCAGMLQHGDGAGRNRGSMPSSMSSKRASCRNTRGIVGWVVGAMPDRRRYVCA